VSAHTPPAPVSAALISQLLRLDQLRALSAGEAEIARASQRESLARLLERADRSAARSDRAGEYLSRYDAMMRHLELDLLVITLQSGERAPPYQLHTSPHAALRALAPALWGTPPEALAAIISARHKAKKEGISPSESALVALSALLHALRGRCG
jgi:hypothetical protein